MFPRRYTPAGFAFAVLVFCLPAFTAADESRPDRRTSNESLFSAQQYLSHIEYLASNELEGRAPGQQGIEQAADYIASVYRQYGLEPAGDDGAYFQQFQLKLEPRIGPKTDFAVHSANRPGWRHWQMEQDFVPFPFSRTGAFEGQVVFAGYGIVDEETGYNDYADLDVAEKVVLILRQTPQFETFGEPAAMFRTKASRANARDAAALLIVDPVRADSPKPLYDFNRADRGPFGFGRKHFGIPMMHISQEAADRLLLAGGLPHLADLQQQIEDRRAPASASLESVYVKGSVDIDLGDTPARNVIGLIPGAGPNANEFIVLGAHYDHVGVHNRTEPTFDPDRDIFNGADDNASGTSALLMLAQAYTQGPPPNRSIVVAAFSAEELGLLGSAYFVQHPTIDLKRCVAMLNYDMIGRLRNNKLWIYGLQTSEGFADLVQRLAGRYDLKVTDGGGVSAMSDHYNFYAAGLPVMFFFTGLHDQYHQPGDDANLINAEGAVRVVKLSADCIDEIDAAAKAPEFQKDERPDFVDIGQEQPDDESPAEEPPGAEEEPAENEQPADEAAAEEAESAEAEESTAEEELAAEDDLNAEEEFAEELEASAEEEELAAEERAAANKKEPQQAKPDRSGAARPPRVKLGVTIVSEDGPGVTIGGVAEDSPAERAGIQPDDRIVHLSDNPVETVRDLLAALDTLKEGDSTTVGVARGDKRLGLRVQFGSPPERRPAGPHQPTINAIVLALQGAIAMDVPDADITLEVHGRPGMAAKLSMKGDGWRALANQAKKGQAPELLRKLLATVCPDGKAPSEVRLRTRSTHEISGHDAVLEIEMSIVPKPPAAASGKRGTPSQDESQPAKRRAKKAA